MTATASFGPLLALAAAGGLVAAGPLTARRPVRRPMGPGGTEAVTARPLRAAIEALPPAQRRWAIALAAATLAAFALSPVLALLVLWGGVAQRVWAARAAGRRREAVVVDLLPDLIDLFRVAVTAGCTPSEALAAVARRAPEPGRDALARVLASQERGASLADALGALPDTLGEPGRPMANGLARALRDGTPLLVPLRRLSTEARAARRRQAEIRARRLPVTLLFPLVLCTLPAFALLTVVPLLISSLGSLRL